MEESEKWVPIPGYEGSYEVSDLGRVRSLDRIITFQWSRVKSGVGQRLARGRILKKVYRKGYPFVDLGSRNFKAVHQLVMLAFVGPCPDGMQVRHDDGDRDNCRLENLLYGTQSDNEQDKIRHGRNDRLNRVRCPQNHLLVLPNLVAWTYAKGYRQCLACARARAHMQYYPIEKQFLGEVSNQYYAEIMKGEAIK